MHGKMSIKIIVAYGRNHEIGYENGMPWHLPNELRWVSKVTRHTTDPQRRNAIVMGRRTWESIPAKLRPLKGRLNVVVSHKSPQRLASENLLYCNSLEEALSQLRHHALIETVFIFGGSTIYKQALELGVVDEIHATELQESFTADTFFPQIPPRYTLATSEDVCVDHFQARRAVYKREPFL
nr:dihydrofolate reductase [uncultured bacterium]